MQESSGRETENRSAPVPTACATERIVHEFNRTSTPYPEHELFHQLFEAQAGRTPDAVAVVFAGEQLTYGELNCRANEVAHALLNCSVAPDDVVGLYAQRGIEMIIGILGILKSGGAYVPLDPAHPTDRLAFVLTQTSPVAIVTHQSLPGIPFAFDGPVIVVERERGERRENPNVPGLTSRHLAYVIYTSGSTGHPKGVMVEHRSVCNLLTAQEREIAIEPDSRVLQFAPVGFDAFVWELLMSLCRGASLHIPPPNVVLIGDNLLDALDIHRITHVTLPPSVLQSVPRSPHLESLSTIVVGGEACPASVIDEWGRGRRMVNAYGPTETTVCVTLHACLPGVNGPPPLGRPIANTRIYVLDEQQQLAPIGTVGEIHVGGVPVACRWLETILASRR